MTTTTEKKKILRVGVYCRVSTSDQDVGMQVAEIRQVASQRGWRIVEEYADEGISGTANDRPALERMMADARRRTFDLLVVWKIDRLARSLSHLLQMLEELASLGVGFISLHDPGLDSTSSGRLMLCIVGAFAQYERDLLRERVASGIRRARQEGVHCGRPKVVLDVRPAVALLAKGHGLKGIATMLKVSRGTLRRRLREAGEWPRKKHGVITTPSRKAARKGGSQAVQNP